MGLTQARRTGLLYLSMSPFTVMALVVVPAAVTVAADATATAERLRSSEWLLRVGIASELISATIFIFVALSFYRLFAPVSSYLAALMVVFVLASVPVSFLNVVPEIAALSAVTRPQYLSSFTPDQLDSLAYLFMRLHTVGLYVTQVFWGLWLLPMALLAFASGFVPRIVGVLLIVAGVSYVMQSAIALLIPPLSASASALVIGEAAELSIIVWLLATRYGSARTQVLPEPGRVRRNG